MKLLSVFVLLSFSILVGAQCPPAFDSNADVCVAESVDFTNVTSGQSYQWDFCAGDIEGGFNSVPVLSKSAFARNRTIKVIEDNEDWYAFTISQTSSNLQRIELGNDLSNPTANYTDLGTFSGQFNRPYDIDLIYDGLWHAFVPNLNAGTIVRLDFNDGIDQPPTFNDLGNFSSNIQAPNHVLIVEDDGNFFVFVSEGQNLVRLSFGSDLTSDPVVDVYAVAGSNALRGLSLMKDCGSWVGLLLSYSNNSVHSVDFSSSLSNPPVFNKLALSGGVSFPANVSLINEDAKYYAFIQGALGSFYRFDFGTSLSDFSFTEQTITDAAFTSNQNFALDIVMDSSKWYGFNFNLDSRELVQLSFTDDCSASITVSSDQSPSGVSYSTGGSYRISSRVESNTGEVGYSSNTITVSSDEAPSASFSIDASRCISNANTFTPNITGLTSYSWDFDGNGTEDSDVESPTHQFPSVGTYTVRLDVNDGTCSNFTEQEITIYPALATPSFDVTSDDLCEQTTFTLTNTIDASAYGESISYEWYLDGALISTQRDTTYVFENAGEKIIGLKSFIPGCESSTTEQTFQIIASPTAAFDVDTVCLSQSSIFTNLSTDADSYSWDFGDGATSTLFEPSHTYTDTGTYVVQLIAFDVSGDCAGELSKSVRVNRKPPTPSFDLNSPFCLESAISLTNLTDDTSFEGVTYEWTITDFGVLTDRDVSITFTEPGEKTFQLQSFYRTCESEIISQTISIGDLPVSNFSAPATCDGDAVVFVNESTGAVSYLWDFGDGSTSVDADPSHLYASADTYTVSLTVTNSDGCENQYDQQVTVSDFPSASFDFELACTASEGVSFSDNSSVANGDIVSWSWMVDGEVVSSEQNPTIVFNSTGIKSVQLDILSSSGCEASHQEMIDITSPISDFSSFTSDVCIGEQLAIVNANPDLSYQWDFCAGDIEEGFLSGAILNSNQFTRNRTIKVIEDDGSWYAFAVSQTSNNLQRIDLGTDLSNSISPTYNSLGEFNNALNGSYDIDLIFDGSIWRAFVANTNNNELIRFDFTNGIQSTPDIVNLGNFSGAIQAPTHTLLMEDEGNYFAFVSSEESIVRLSYGGDLTSDPVVDVFSVAGSNTLRGFDLIKDCDSWIGLILSYNDGSVYSVDFSTSLSNTPTFNELALSNTVSFPSNVEIINENAEYYCFIQGALGDLYRFDFGTSISDFTFTEQSIADAVFTADQNFALDIVNDSSQWFGFNFNLDQRELIQLSFLDDCSSSIASSNDASPDAVYYSTGGSYNIALRVASTSGNTGYSSRQITVSSDVSPAISFIVNDSRCIANTNTFTPNLTGLTSYSWDFDGDNVEDSNVESPTYQYASPGIYTVRLDVTDGTCSNFTEQEITIYPEPPVPSFDIVSDDLCERTTLNLTNTTDETGFDDALTYEWYLGGELISSERDTIYVFETSGEKVIGLKSFVPGCESTIAEQTIQIIPLPEANFTSDTVCLDQISIFANLSVNADSYSWDFGDGASSTLFEPTHLYADTGTYIVELTAFDASGDCAGVLSKSVRVNRKPPTPSFNLNSPFCLDSEINLSNLTDDMSFNDEVTYEWTITDFGVLTDRDVSITFTEPGDKTFQLQTFYRTCESTITSQTISIGELPSADFLAPATCDGNAVVFENSSINASTFLWDFGDGNTSTSSSPEHQYDTPDTYLVTLTATDPNGCENQYQEEVVISASPEVGFTFDISCNASEGVLFNDLSSVENGDIVSWIWMVDGEVVSNDQNPKVRFNSPGTKVISLEVTSSFGCPSIYQEAVDVTPPVLDYSTFKEELCIGEQLAINNTSSGLSYQWDFCAGDIEAGFSSESLLMSNQFTRNRTIKVIEDQGAWYAFSVSQTSNNLQRIDLGSDLLNVNTVYNDLGEFGNTLNGAYDIDLIYDGTIWRGYVANTNSNELIRFDFTNGISETPEIVNLGNFSNTVPSPTHILLKEDEGNYFAFVSSEESIVRLSYGNDLSSDPLVDVFDVTGSNLLRGFDLIKDCGSWVGFILSFSNNQIYSVDFGSSLSNEPTLGLLATTNTIRFPANIEILNENARYYSFVQGGLGNFYRFDFGSSLSDFSFSDQTIVDAAFTSNQNFALDIVNDSSQWVGFNFNLDSRELVQLTFVNDCSASIAVSSDQSPNGVSYSAGGSYRVSSRVESNTGEVGYSSNAITVSSDEAPSASFSIDASRCISNANTFTPNLTGLTNYDWDFGDGNTSSDESPTHQYASTGTYTVRLDVVDGSCNNFTEQEITIYSEPPVPSFDMTPTTYCFGSELTFVNTTDETGLEDVITYSWAFDSEAEINSTNASFTFLTSGTKIVTLTASIPGCDAIFEQEIEILPGPTSTFTSSVVCQNEATTFTNNSLNAVSHYWDLGDGFESTAENPTHLYSIAGSYMATLVTTDANGCTNEVTNEVIVQDIPVVSFDFELACSSIDGVQFTDMSTVDNADIVTWSWFVDEEEVSTIQNPIISFESPGIKTIRLIAQSSNGCESAHEEEIDIRSSPEPDFSFEIGCQGEPSSFFDITSDVGNPITQWLWTIDGVTYNTEDVSHVFESNGFFEVMLEVTAENFCSESIVKTIEVKQLPIVSFSSTGSCSNEIIEFIDSSIDFEDVIVSRTWMIDGEVFGNGTQVLIENLSSGTYNIELEVETEQGCTVSATQDIEINPTPISSFTSSKTYGLPGDEITFGNSSTGASQYQWLSDGDVISTSSEEVKILFSETGSHTVSLVATNAFGCIDTTSTNILIAIPEVDLVIADLQIVDQNGIGKVFLDIQNLSNLPVEIIEVIVKLEDNFAASDQVLQFIDMGSTQRVSLDIGIPLTSSKPSFICVTLQSQFTDYADINPLNNEKCLTLDPKVKVEAPFPNPVTDEFRMKVVLPKESKATVSLVNSVGKIEQSSTYEMDDGLNNIFIDMSNLSTGIYFVNIELDGKVTTHRVMKL